MSKSSKKLLVTQSAISQTIKEIEEQYKVKLFIRKNKKLFITDEGKRLYTYTKKIVNLINETHFYLKNIEFPQDGTIYIGASTTIGNYLLPELVKSFKNEYPLAEVNVFIGNSREVEEKLNTYDINVGLTEGLPATDSSSIKVTKFMEDELVLVCSPNHPFAKRKAISLNELQNEYFIVREKGSGTREIIEKELERKGIFIKFIYEINSSEAIKSAVSCNLGISILSKLMIRKEIASNTLCQVKIKGLRMKRWFYLLQNDSCNKLQSTFSSHILKITRILM